MKTRITTGAIVLAGLLATSVARADEPAPPDAPDTAPAAQPEAPSAEQAFTALEGEFNAARKAYAEATRARPAGEPWPKDWKAPPRPETVFARRYVAGAAPFAGTEGAVPFLLKAAGLGRTYDKDACREALDTIVASHAESPRLHEMTFTLIYGVYSLGEELVLGVASKLAAASPHADVQASMHYVRGAVVRRRGPADDAEAAGAVAELRRAIEIAPESRYGKMATGDIYELENLQVGMIAPDIEGEDLDGVAFRLSDYRGKVVMLDFWGDW